MLPVARKYVACLLVEDHTNFQVVGITLNEEQMTSLMWSICHQIVLIQGSAGTGKSFTLSVIATILKMMNPMWRLCSGTVANIAIDKYIGDLLKLRIKYGTQWSSEHSDPTYGERAWGRIGSDDLVGIPCEGKKVTMTTPYGKYGWITPELCEREGKNEIQLVVEQVKRHQSSSRDVVDTFSDEDEYRDKLFQE